MSPFSTPQAPGGVRRPDQRQRFVRPVGVLEAPEAAEVGEAGLRDARGQDQRGRRPGGRGGRVDHR